MSQISYLNEPGGLAAGMKADTGDDYVRSYRNTTGAVVPFGIGVARNGLVSPTNTLEALKRQTSIADDMIGITTHSHVGNSSTQTWPQSSVPFGQAGAVLVGAPDGVEVNVTRQGRTWAFVEAAVNPDLPVFMRLVANGAGKDVVGAFRGDSDGGTCALVDGASFLSVATAAGVAVIELVGRPSTRRGAGGAGSAARIQAVAGAETANAINVACQIFDEAGNALTSARSVLIESFAVTDSGGDLAAATVAPLGTVVKANNPATGPNTMAMTTTAGGLFSFSVTNAAVEQTFVRITADGCPPRVLPLNFV